MATTTRSASASATKPSPSTTAELAAGAAQFLTPVVIDLEALVVNGKQAHWHVRGASFVGIHERLDELVEHVQEYADTAAERVIALGLPLDARVETVAKKNTLPSLSEGFQSWDATVAEIVRQIDAALVTVREAVKGLDEVDLSTQDVAIEIERGLTKERWLLQAHIAG